MRIFVLKWGRSLFVDRDLDFAAFLDHPACSWGLSQHPVGGDVFIVSINDTPNDQSCILHLLFGFPDVHVAH